MKLGEKIENLWMIYNGLREDLRYPHKYIKILDGRGSALVHRLEDGDVVREISVDGVVEDLGDFFARGDARRVMDTSITLREAKEMAGTLLQRIEPYEGRIKPIAFTNDKGLCYHRLPFEPSKGAFPAFKEFLGRFEMNADAFCAWVGSLFVEESYRQQFVYIRGDGRDGKGTFLNLLKYFFGPAYRTSLQTPNQAGKHWTSQLIGCRVMAFPDCPPAYFLENGHFKSLTGDDLIPIEQKYRPVYMAELNTKFIVCSNEELNIEDAQSNNRRLIYVTLRSFEGAVDSKFLNQLIEEAPHILDYCLKKYRELCPTHGEIAATNGDEIYAGGEDQYEAFFQRHLVEAPGSSVPCHVVAARLRDYGIRRGPEQARYIRYMARAHGVVKARVAGRRVYLNVRDVGWQETSTTDAPGYAPG